MKGEGKEEALEQLAILVGAEHVDDIAEKLEVRIRTSCVNNNVLLGRLVGSLSAPAILPGPGKLSVFACFERRYATHIKWHPRRNSGTL